jgi:protein gp37
MGHKNVFVCSMADLFGRWVPAEWIEAVLAACRAAPQWNFLFLTKFPQRMAEFEFADNFWLGTTVDCQARVANAEKAFRKLRSGVKWLSLEPMLEPLRFDDLGAFQWLVVGGASKSSQTPEWHPPLRWIVELREQALAAGVPFYCKTNLDAPRVRGYPGDPPYLEPTEPPAELVYLPRDHKT